MDDGKAPSVSNVLCLVGVSLVMLGIGFAVFARGNRRLAEEL
jgi:hypothetical protein